MNRRDLLQAGLALGACSFATAALPKSQPAQALQTTMIPWLHAGEPLPLALHRQPAQGDAVLYVHGATFPCALSVGWRMHGVSWLDDLQRAGFDAWALDFAGYGASARPLAFAHASGDAPPFGRHAVAAEQIAVALRHIRKLRPGVTVHLIAHSWGTLPAQQVAIDHPREVARLVLFGPVVPRSGSAHANPPGAWSLVDEAAQRPRQRTGLPDGVATPVDEAEIDRWCAAYLASDPSAATRAPPSVKVPNGPAADIAALWAGQSLLDSAELTQPVLIVRGEWDHVSTDEDARRLFDSLQASADKRDVKISGGNHWLHLQPRRSALWAQTRSFLMER